MKNICIITQHPFWAEPLGCGTLLRARYELLQSQFDNVFVLFITRGSQSCPLVGATLRVQGNILQEHINGIQNYLIKNQISICYFSYDNHGVLPQFTNCLNIVEIHDVLHLRAEQFKKYGYKPPIEKTKVDELESLRQYDIVFSINTNEVSYLRKNDVPNTYYFPPNRRFSELNKTNKPGNYGLIASRASPNVDGFNCLPGPIKSSENFVIAGPLSKDPTALSQINTNALAMGIVSKPLYFYQTIDLAISPLRFGGGLKIKVFEALSYGVPILATKHSIDGFPGKIDDVVTIEDDIEAWNLDLLNDSKLTKSSVIKDYFLHHCHEHRCAEIIQKLV